MSLQLSGRVMFGPNVTFGVSNVVVSTDPGKGCVGGEPAGQGLEITRWGATLQRRGSDKQAKLERMWG